MKKTLGLLLGGTLATCGFAHAATTTANFDVTITIPNLCDVSTTAPTNMAFATPTSLTAAIDQTSTITLRCTTNTAYNVGLSAGTGTGATVTARKMTGLTTTTATVGYNLYSDTNRTTNWGNTPNTDTVNGSGNGSNQVLTVYGRVPAASLNPAPIAQNYKDTITVTVTY